MSILADFGKVVNCGIQTGLVGHVIRYFLKTKDELAKNIKTLHQLKVHYHQRGSSSSSSLLNATVINQLHALLMSRVFLRLLVDPEGLFRFVQIARAFAGGI